MPPKSLFSAPTPLQYFAALVAEDSGLALLEAAVSIAQDEYPELDVQTVLSQIDTLGAKLKAVHEEKPDQRVFMRGDKAVDYGKMMEVMGVVIDSGFRQLGLLGEQAQQLGRGGGTVTPVPPQQQPAPRR